MASNKPLNFSKKTPGSVSGLIASLEGSNSNASTRDFSAGPRQPNSIVPKGFVKNNMFESKSLAIESHSHIAKSTTLTSTEPLHPKIVTLTDTLEKGGSSKHSTHITNSLEKSNQPDLPSSLPNSSTFAKNSLSNSENKPNTQLHQSGKTPVLKATPSSQLKNVSKKSDYFETKTAALTEKTTDSTLTNDFQHNSTYDSKPIPETKGLTPLRIPNPPNTINSSASITRSLDDIINSSIDFDFGEDSDSEINTTPEDQDVKLTTHKNGAETNSKPVADAKDNVAKGTVESSMAKLNGHDTAPTRNPKLSSVTQNTHLFETNKDPSKVLNSLSIHSKSTEKENKSGDKSPIQRIPKTESSFISKYKNNLKNESPQNSFNFGNTVSQNREKISNYEKKALGSTYIPKNRDKIVTDAGNISIPHSSLQSFDFAPIPKSGKSTPQSSSSVNMKNPNDKLPAKSISLSATSRNITGTQLTPTASTITKNNGKTINLNHQIANAETKPLYVSTPLSVRKSSAGHSITLEPIEADNNTLDRDLNDVIFAVCVVGFHHVRGPEVEYWIGGDRKDQSKLWPNLPFQCLPDGSHSHEENFCYFSLLYDIKNKTAPRAVPTRDKVGNIVENIPDMTNVTTLFGLSCNRQLKATDLKERPADVTRSTVQKSVVVIARKPIFGAIREKLAVITRAYFQQGDFEDRYLVDSLYDNLVQMFSNKIDESDMYVGMSVRELVYRLRSKVLVLLKALLLEKKIFFFGNNTETLCASQFALVSLIPNLINHLDDCGSPLLKTYESKLKKPNTLKSSDRNSLLNYMGLPLQIFAEGGLFTAYVPLQQMNELKAPETKFFLVGSTNSLLLAPQNRVADIIVYVDTDNVEVINSSLNSALELSLYDKKWMDMVVSAVVNTWDPEDPGRPKGLGFYGSEDFVRLQFEDYLKGLLSAVKYDKFFARANHLKQPMPTLRQTGPNEIKYFHNNWIKEWRTTNNFRIFSKFTDDELFDIVEPRHVVHTIAPLDNEYSGQSSDPQHINGNTVTSTRQSTNEMPSKNGNIKTSKSWGSLWWSQPEPPKQQSPSTSGVPKSHSAFELKGNAGKHQTNPSDEFQDTALYDQGEAPVKSGRDGHSYPGGSHNNAAGLLINRRTQSPTTSSGTNGGSVGNETASRKSSVSTTSSFFSGWSLWGSNNKDNGDSSSNNSTKS